MEVLRGRALSVPAPCCTGFVEGCTGFVEPRVLACDLDGVVVDLRESIKLAVVRGLARMFPRTAGGECDPELGYDLSGLGLSETQRQSLYAAVFDDPATYAFAEPVSGAVSGLGRLVRSGWQVVGVTARPAHLRGVTLKWLRQHDVPIGHVVFSAVGRKADHARALGAVASVEDRPDEADLLARVCRSFLFEQPHNRGAAAAYACRVRSWHELVGHLGQQTLWPRAG